MTNLIAAAQPAVFEFSGAANKAKTRLTCALGAKALCGRAISGQCAFASCQNAADPLKSSSDWLKQFLLAFRACVTAVFNKSPDSADTGPVLQKQDEQSLQPGFFFCDGCKGPREPAMGIVIFNRVTMRQGRLEAHCAQCDAKVCRPVFVDDLPAWTEKCDIEG